MIIEKKITLVASAILSVLLITWNQIGNYRLCDYLSTNGSNGNCPFILTDIGLIFIPVLSVFIIALITYRMREEVYQAWFRFVRWALPLSMFLILITPEYGGGLVNPIQKGNVAFLLTILFFVISLIIIVVKYFRAGR